MTFGQNLRFYRRKCGYTQAALAARLLGVEMESFFEGSAEERRCAR